jgi:urease accessory protein
MGEQVNNAVFSDHIELRRQGELLFLDRTQLRGDIAAHLAGPHLGAGAGALSTVLFVHSGAGAHLAPIREIIGENGGATLLRDDVMFVRMLAADSHVLRQALIPVLTRLSANDLPRPWMI